MKTLIVWLAFAALSCGMAELRENREEIGGLKEQSEAGGAIAQELEEQHKSFEAVRIAVAEGRLELGTEAKTVTKRFGRPSVDSPEGEGREWLYVARSPKWLQMPRVALYFDKKNRLGGWECFYADCGERRTHYERRAE